MITSAIPIIAVSDSARAEDYYCRVLGFELMSAYPPNAVTPDPRYLAIARDGVWLHLQSFKPERAGLTDAFFWVTDVEALHQEFVANGAVIQLPPTDQTWGTREIGVRDPDGNVLGFAIRQPSPKPNVDELNEITLRVSRLPVLDSRPADEILGYDENGLPS